MNNKTRSILTELDSLVSVKNKHSIVESRSNHIIESAIKLFDYIESNYSDEEALELQKRFFSSLRNKDPKRFERGIKKIKSIEESKNNAK